MGSNVGKSNSHKAENTSTSAEVDKPEETVTKDGEQTQIGKNTHIGGSDSVKQSVDFADGNKPTEISVGDVSDAAIPVGDGGNISNLPSETQKVSFMNKGDSSESRVVDMSEVSLHCSGSSCWVVIRDRVYDVTKFLGLHPGGTEVLLEQGGRDATGAFEDVMHSTDADELMLLYYIGTLHTNS